MVTTIRCPKCGTLSDEGVDFCVDCDTFLPWTQAEVCTRHEAGIELGLSQTHIDVVPGGEASLEVTIRNTGRNVDRVDLDVEGVGAGWTVVEPGTISLLPGAGSVAQLIMRPPRDATVSAGRHLLELRGRSSIDATVSAEQRASVDVASFDDLRVRMTPPTSRGTTRTLHRVVVENAGNHAVTVSLHGRDRDGEVAVELQPSVLELQGGASAAAVATVSPMRPLRDGSARPLPFVIVVQAGPSETTLDGVMIQEPEAARAPLPEPAATAPPTTVAAVGPAPRRRRRWWPRILGALVLVGGLVAAALAVIPVDELRDRFGVGDQEPVEVTDVADAIEEDGSDDDPLEGDAAGSIEDQGGDVGALPDLTVTAVQCAFVPDDGELRFAVEVANRGAALRDPVTVRAAAGDLAGSADVPIDGLATAVLAVPIDDDVLGSELAFTIAIDPDEAVEEADERNNAGVITITLPASASQPVSLCG